MLSKQVKRRRKINYLVRKLHPAWKYCLITYKQHQITLAQMAIRSAIHIEDPAEREACLKVNRAGIEKAKYEMDHMTRAEFTAEIGKGCGHCGSYEFRSWAKLILDK